MIRWRLGQKEMAEQDFAKCLALDAKRASAIEKLKQESFKFVRVLS